MSVRDGSSSEFFERLESLRGFAALWVVVSHSMIWLKVYSGAGIWTQTLWQTHGSQAVSARFIIGIFNGAAAVDIFFVLSGFVLARSIRSNPINLENYVNFIVKRIFRIMPAFWLSLIVAIAYLLLIYPGYTHLPGASRWFNWWYSKNLSISEVMRNAFFASSTLNPNAWTLKIEVLTSLVLPLMVLGAGLGSRARSVLMLTVVVLITIIMRHDSTSFLYYLYMFAAGVVVSQQRNRVEGNVASNPVFIAVCIACIVAPGLFLRLAHTPQADIPIVMGASGLVWSIASNPAARTLSMLDRHFVRFLGRISYSFYLMGFICLYGCANFVLHTFSVQILSRWPLPIMVATSIVSIALTITVSYLSFKFVEKPSTIAGRRLRPFRKGRPRLQQEFRN